MLSIFSVYTANRESTKVIFRVLLQRGGALELSEIALFANKQMDFYILFMFELLPIIKKGIKLSSAAYLNIYDYLRT